MKKRLRYDTYLVKTPGDVFCDSRDRQTNPDALAELAAEQAGERASLYVCPAQ